MKADLFGQIPLGVLLLLLLVEATMWFDCYQMTDAKMENERFIAISTPCNEEADIYRDHLNCEDIKRSLQSGTAWVRSGSCLLKKHNFFALLGWIELAAVGGAALVLLLVFIHFRLKIREQNSWGQKFDLALSHSGRAMTYPLPPHHHQQQYYQQPRSYYQSSGVIIEEMED